MSCGKTETVPGRVFVEPVHSGCTIRLLHSAMSSVPHGSTGRSEANRGVLGLDYLFPVVSKHARQCFEFLNLRARESNKGWSTPYVICMREMSTRRIEGEIGLGFGQRHYQNERGGMLRRYPMDAYSPSAIVSLEQQRRDV